MSARTQKQSGAKRTAKQQPQAHADLLQEIEQQEEAGAEYQEAEDAQKEQPSAQQAIESELDEILDDEGHALGDDIEPEPLAPVVPTNPPPVIKDTKPEFPPVDNRDMPSHLRGVHGVHIASHPERAPDSLSDYQDDPIVANMVFALVIRGSSTNGTQELMPLHEVPLLKAAVSALDPGNSDNVKVLAQFPLNRKQTRMIGEKKVTIMDGRYKALYRSEVSAELERLQSKYIISGSESKSNLVTQFYGTGVRDLINAMRNIEYAMRIVDRDMPDGYRVSDAQMHDVLQYASPDHDLMISSMNLQGYQDFDPAQGAGYDIASNVATVSDTRIVHS